MGYKIPIFASVTPSTSNDTWLPVMNTKAGVNMNSEALVNTPFFESGTLDAMAVSVFANSAAGTTNVYFRKNGADGNMTVAIGAGATGRFYDLSNTDTVANGDLCSWRLDRGGAVQFGFVGAYYETDSGIIVNKVGIMGSANSATSTNALAFIGSVSDVITDGSAAQCPTIDVACEAKAIWIYNSASRTNTVTFSDRINAGAGGLSVTVPANTTGLRTNTGTTSIAAGDNYNLLRANATGTKTFTMTMGGVDLHYPANEFQIFAASSGVSFSATTARYAIPAGAYSASVNFAGTAIKMYGSGKIKNLRVYISANAATVAQLWHCMITSATSLTTTSGIAATGLFSDTTNQPTFTNNVDMNIRYLKSTGSGATTLRWTCLTIEFDIDFIPQAIWF